jgi:RimJ/RimL family protein N-acetyltransferase
VLEGVYPGRVFVDDRDRPQTAFLVVWDNWCFLSGDPNNDAFNQALNQAIFEKQVVEPEVRGLLITCHPPGWNGQLGVVSHPHEPVPVRRKHYICRELAYDWRANLPAGFELARLDEKLLERPGLAVPDPVRETIERWSTIDHERFQDFGFVAICEEAAEVAAWATVDFVASGMGDVGMVTQLAYRRRGLAAVTTGAAVEHGLTHGLSWINWTTAQDNVGSIRTAEKLGFEWVDDYVMYYLVFDEVHHQAQLAYARLQDGRYQEAAELYEEVLERSDDLPPWVLFDTARAWAGLDKRDKALAYLHRLAEAGWTQLGDVEDCREFQALHGSPEWTAILDRIRENQQVQTAR